MSTLIPSSRQSSLDERLIPLINVVFLLLIFFMIAGQISNQQNHDIQPPQSRSEAPAPIPDWLIEVDTAGTLSLNGTALTQVQLQERLSVADHRMRLAIKMDRSLKARDLDAVLKVVRGGGISTVRLLTAALGQ